MQFLKSATTILVHRLSKYLEEADQHSPGFRSKMSTIYQLLKIATDIQCSLNRNFICK